MRSSRCAPAVARRAVTAACTAVAVACIQAPVLASTGSGQQPAVHQPEFLTPAKRPANSSVAPPAAVAPPARTEAATPTDQRDGSRWDTHPERRPTKAAAEDLARTSGKRVLVTGTLREDSTEYANPDGTTTLELTAGPSRVRRGDGWTDVDPTLVRRGDRLVAAAVVGELTLSAGGDRRLLELGRGGHSFEVDWPTVLPAPRVAGATATYPGVFAGADLVVRALRYGYEQSIVLHARPAGPLAYELPLRLPNGQSARQSGGNVALTDDTGARRGPAEQHLDPH